MKTKPKISRSFAEAMSAVVPAASIGGFPRPEPASVPSLPALAEAENQLALLRKDHARNVDEQRAIEQEGRSASAELIGSRVIIERKIAAAERGLVELHREQARAAYAADADEWASLQRQRALTVLVLRKLNRVIDERKASYRSGGIDAELPCGDAVIGYQLLGLDLKRPGRTGLGAAEYLRQCQRAGFISTQELDEND
jgi:hypothetical protein